jgi:DNA-binding SARP family transcriptional activator
VRVSVLGPLRVVGDDGAVLDVTAPKQRAVLTFLALEAGRAVDTADLIDAVWGDDPPRSVVKALQTYISALRRLLTPGRIETDAGRYRLVVSPDDVDVHNFDTGPPLGTYPGWRFESWLPSRHRSTRRWLAWPALP